MSKFRITCARHEAEEGSHGGGHIVAVGTGRGFGQHDTLWAIDEILAAMEQGHVFYTKGETSGKKARVERFTCSSCRQEFIRSNLEAGEDNRLESLPRCK